MSFFGEFEEDWSSKVAMGKDGHFKVNLSFEGSKIRNNSSFKLLECTASEDVASIGMKAYVVVINIICYQPCLI